MAYPQFHPFSLGQVMTTGENILNARASRDPNSLKNQLLRAQIDVTQAKAKNPNPGKYGLNPFLVRDPGSGEIKAFQMYSGGGMAEVPMPEGFGPATKGTWKDTGGGLQFFEPYGPANPAPTPTGGVPASTIQEMQSSVPSGVVPKTLPPEKQPDYIGEAEKAKQTEITAAASDRKKQEALGAAAAKTAEKAFDQIDKINTSLYNLADGIAALESGAQTGPVAQFFPTLRESTMRLKNAQSRMGLDVVGAVTFGALSKGELDLALQTAMPTGLNEPELLAWMKNKQAAQMKLAKYLEEQAIFLSQPGNTQAKWLEKIQAGAAVDPRTGGGLESDFDMEDYNKRKQRLLSNE